MFKKIPAVLLLLTIVFSTVVTAQCVTPVSFPYFNGFENETVDAMPTCFTLGKIPGGGDTLTAKVGAGNAYQGSKRLEVAGALYSIMSGNGWLFFPAMNFTAGQIYNLSFKYRALPSPTNYSNYSTRFQVYYGSSPTHAGMTNNIGCGSAWSSFYTPFSVNITPPAGTGYIGIRVYYTYESGTVLWLDDIKVIENGSTACPGLTGGITVTNDSLNFSTANLKWANIPGSGTSYDWELRTNIEVGEPVGLVSNGSGIDTSITLNGLNGDTRYYFYARTKCNGVTPGTWASTRFKTRSPEYATMALPVNIVPYSFGPMVSTGVIGTSDFMEAGDNNWYSFTPNQSRVILQIRNKLGYTVSGAAAGMMYDLYTAKPDGTPGGLVSSNWLSLTSPYQFCIEGTCYTDFLGGSEPFGGQTDLPTVIPGQKYFIRFRTGTTACDREARHCIKSFRAVLMYEDRDVWTGIGTTETRALNGTDWKSFHDRLDGKFFGRINPQGMNGGNVMGKAFIKTGALRLDSSGRKYFDRSFRFISNVVTSGNYKVRLYFTQAELQRFTDTTGNQLQDLRVLFNNDSILTTNPSSGVVPYIKSGQSIMPVTGTYYQYYYLEFETDKLGTFYIYGTAPVVPDTGCPTALIPYFNGFEDETVNVIPTCYTIGKISGDSLLSSVQSENAYQGTKSLKVSASPGSLNMGSGWLFLPRFNFAEGLTYTISFQYRSQHTNTPYNPYPTDFTVYYGSGPSNAGMTTNIGCGSSWRNTYTSFSTDFTPQAGPGCIGIKIPWNPESGSAIWVDNIRIIENGSLSCPKVINGLTVTNDSLDFTKATFKWARPSGSVSPYNWELRTNIEVSQTIGRVSSGTINDSSLSLSGLNADTRYYLFVRSSCSGIVPGKWASIRFKTTSPEYASMALSVNVSLYNFAGGGGFTTPADFNETGELNWHTFIPNQSKVILQVRDKVSYLPLLNGGVISYDLYNATTNGTLGTLVSSATLDLTSPYQFCVEGTCYPGRFSYSETESGGQFALPALVPGQKYFIRFRGDAGPAWCKNAGNSIRFFTAAFMYEDEDVWPRPTISTSYADQTLLLSGDTAKSFHHLQEGGIFARVSAQGMDAGDVTGKAFIKTGAMRRDSSGIKYFDRSFRFISNTITTGNYRVKLYFTQADLQRFTDSTGKQLSDLRVLLNNDSILISNPPDGVVPLISTGQQIIPTSGTYYNYYYLEFETPDLGTFYIHGGIASVPEITQHPVSVILSCSDSLITLFTAATYGLPAATVQWQRSTDGGATWTNINGANNSGYTFIFSGNAFSGTQYRAAWTNGGGTVYSNPATIRRLAATLTAPCCQGAPITANANAGISHITWFLNGNIVASQIGNWQPNATNIAGGNGSGTGANQFTNAFGVAQDRAGNVYVADAGNHRIQKFAPGSNSGVTVAGGNGMGAAANQLNNPRGVFVDTSGVLYIADAGNNRVLRWFVNATSGITVAGGNGQGFAADQLDFPHGVYVDVPGNVYVADANNNRIQKFASGNTQGVTVAGGNGAGAAANQLTYATGVFVDSAANVYISDFNNNRVQKWAANTITGTTVAGGNGQGSGASQLDAPRGLSVDCSGNVYVADQNNHRIQKWAPGATSGTTIAGGNGSGSTANQLSSPAAVYVNDKGNIYVADRLNQRIQQFSLTNSFSYTPIQDGVYTAQVSSGCCMVTTSQVIINPSGGSTICPGGSTYFVSGAGPGNTYQWQENSEGSYVFINNNALYSGTGADTLRLNAAPTSLHGYKFRCLINGTTYSPEYTLKFGVSWTGTASTAWENPANWNCGVLPDGNTDVMINPGLSNYPQVNANTSCGSLKLMPGTTVTVKTGMKLDVKRRL
ncbi:MAG: hypothetical protein V4722_25310 [Bacteroidota bacterium]